MRLVVPALMGLALVGCSQKQATGDARPAGKPARFSREEVLRNREALAMTAAYRAKAGIATETIAPHDPSDRDPLTRMRLARTNPEYGTTTPMIQGVDDVTPARKDAK